MDGITALPRLLQTKPGVAVIMASTLTLKGASVSMKAMSLGASDYVPKPTTTGAISAATDFKADLVEKVKSWAQAGRRKRGIAAPSPTAERRRCGAAHPSDSMDRQPVKLRDMPPLMKARLPCHRFVDGRSAGTCSRCSRAIGKITHLPVFVTQHMPATFTTILAEHLGQAAGMPSAEAKDGEPVVPGRIFVAPGDFHMVVEGDGRTACRAAQQEPA